MKGSPAFADLIKVTGGSGVTVRFLNIVDATSSGLEFKNATGDRAFCNCVARNVDGIELHGGQGHEVSRNFVTRNSNHGIKVRVGSISPKQHTIRDNLVEESGTDGIQLDSTSEDIVSGNTSRRNLAAGIQLSDATRTRVTGNTTVDNGVCGIELTRSNRNTINDNVGANPDPRANPICCASGSDNTGNNVTPACR